MKKFISVILVLTVLIMPLCLVSCGKSAETVEEKMIKFCEEEDQYFREFSKTREADLDEDREYEMFIGEYSMSQISVIKFKNVFDAMKEEKSLNDFYEKHSNDSSKVVRKGTVIIYGYTEDVDAIVDYVF